MCKKKSVPFIILFITIVVDYRVHQFTLNTILDFPVTAMVEIEVQYKFLFYQTTDIGILSKNMYYSFI